MAAPAITPSRSAAANADSSTVAPRPTLMKYADGFMLRSSALPIILSVSRVTGVFALRGIALACEHRHAERLCETRELPTDAAVADDAERGATQFARHEQ